MMIVDIYFEIIDIDRLDKSCFYSNQASEFSVRNLFTDRVWVKLLFLFLFLYRDMPI